VVDLFQLQALDNAPLFQMDIEDFVDVGLIDIGVPDTFRVDHQHRPLVAAIHAARAVDAAFPFAVEVGLFDFFLEVVAHGLSTCRATASGAIVALVGAEKHVVLEIRVSHQKSSSI
jgi:hypothetical protein